jgi:hypothetical protein
VAEPIATPVTVQDWERVQSLVEHFNDSQTASHVQQERAVRRQARKRHRPFRLSLFSIVVCAWTFTVLTALLLSYSRASSASHQSLKLDKEIAHMRDDIASAQRKISSLDSSPHLATWARQRSWTQASSDRIDDVTKTVAPAIAALPENLSPDSRTPDGGGGGR